ncbi:MAG: J domain-containing protein [Sandaracinaceae bacterium]|nr:J domain-containing protein [Sandaracinaceae bacterium]
MADRDLYKILGVAKDANADAIKKAYRKLARELHPDRNPGNKPAEERFKDVAHANEILSDAKKRALYDEFGEVALREGFDVDQARRHKNWQSGGQGESYSTNFEDIFGARGQQGGGGFSFNIEDLIGGRGVQDFFGGRGGKRGNVRRPGKGADQQASITVSFVDALRGTEKELLLQRPALESSAPIRVRIPAGVSNGGKLRLKEQGGSGVDGGPSGDLLLTVHVEDHPYFRREGHDLHLSLPVTVSEAWFGAKVRVPTLDGDVSLSVPPKTQSGATLRLRGKGVAARAPNAAGDLYVHVMIELPRDPALDVDELMRTLGSAYGTDVRAKVQL